MSDDALARAMRERLLHSLRHETYVMLRPSPIAGVGVFAIRDIPKGCRDVFSAPDPAEAWIAVSRDDVEALPGHARSLVENYCLFDDVQYWLPARGFKQLDVVVFLNHSDTPNIVSLDDGDMFETLRDIRAGESLLVDYGELVDDAE